MRRCARPLAAAALAVAALAPVAAQAHAARVEARVGAAVVVEARFEDGTPMAGAQIAVFAPDDPRAPRLRGVADEAGRFVFLPDGPPGRWTVQARLAGHGAMATVEARPAEAAEPPRAETPPASALQRMVMAASVVWGCVGTALYFRRGRA